MSLINTGQIDVLSRFLDAAVLRHQLITSNIANIDTPGFSRQRAELAESAALYDGSSMVGTGVMLQHITSLRNRILELRLEEERQQNGRLQAQVDSLGDIDLQFSTTNKNVGDCLNAFFNSLSNLSADPSNVSLRESALMTAQNLANQFQSTSAVLHQRQFSLDLEVEQAVGQVNEITGQVAKLNEKIAASGLLDDQIGSYIDERNLLLQRLSSLVGAQVINADEGLSVTTLGGDAMVVGGKNYPVEVTRNVDGSLSLSSGGRVLAQETIGGKVKGLLQVRSEVIPEILSQLDAIASNLVTTFNSVHHAGIDLDGNAGENFFVPYVGGQAGASAAMAVAITDPRQIAASADGSAGDNSNLNGLIALNSQSTVNGQRMIDAYASLAFAVGSQLSNARDDLQASGAMVQQLTDQRGALSGVSLDEEASNLIRFQRAYEAAARVLSVISDLTEVSVNLGK